ncbi:MAG: hypothetical protein K0R84_1942, partial [Clostridia bacterium]|nr:hypothetical protein [Clostridia bacterium]
MKHRLLSKLSVFLFIVILFYSISFSFTALNVNAGALTAIDGIHSFGSTYFAYDGSSSATSIDGNFTISTNKYTFASETDCAWINDMTMAGTEDVIITVGKNIAEPNGVNSLRSFKLNNVDVGEFVADGIYSVTIIGYIGDSEVFRTETYIDGQTGIDEHYSLNMSNALDKVIDNFKIFYTKAEGTDFAHENFTLYSFEVSEASSDAPPAVAAPSVVSITRKTPAEQLTNASSVTYLVTFSESVSGVDNNDFRLTGTAAGTIAEFTGASGAAIEVAVNNINGDGILELECIGTGITDTEGNAISGGFDTGEYYIIDKSAPRVNSIERLTPLYELTNVSSVVYRVTFNEDVSGVDIADFRLNKTLDAAGTIFLIINHGTQIVDVTVNEISGNGTLGLECIGTGITDIAGNEINQGFTGQTYIIDTTPPAIISQSPADNALDADKTSNLAITFSDTVLQGSGSILLKKASDGSTVDTVLTGWGTNIITINPTNDLAELEGYYILIDNDAVMDSAGNYFAGISDAAEWNFTVKDSTPPAVTSVSTINKTYKAGDDILITCIFNENITVNAGGSIKLNIG